MREIVRQSWWVRVARWLLFLSLTVMFLACAFGFACCDDRNPLQLLSAMVCVGVWLVAPLVALVCWAAVLIGSRGRQLPTGMAAGEVDTKTWAESQAHTIPRSSAATGDSVTARDGTMSARETRT